MPRRSRSPVASGLAAGARQPRDHEQRRPRPRRGSRGSASDAQSTTSRSGGRVGLGLRGAPLAPARARGMTHGITTSSAKPTTTGRREYEAGSAIRGGPPMSQSADAAAEADQRDEQERERREQRSAASGRRPRPPPSRCCSTLVSAIAAAFSPATASRPHARFGRPPRAGWMTYSRRCTAWVDYEHAYEDLEGASARAAASARCSSSTGGGGLSLSIDDLAAPVHLRLGRRGEPDRPGSRGAEAAALDRAGARRRDLPLRHAHRLPRRRRQRERDPLDARRAGRAPGVGRRHRAAARSSRTRCSPI